MNRQPLPRPLQLYISVVFITGMGFLGYLVSITDWKLSYLSDWAMFFALAVIAGVFPLPVAPKVKTDVTTAVLFGVVLVLDPAVAAVVGATGITVYTFLLRFWGDRLRLPWYKYPFNAGAVALYLGGAALLFDTVSADHSLTAPTVAATALVMYLGNTLLVTGAASIQIRMNPLQFWWLGTKQTGPMEAGLFAFGYLGAVAITESHWMTFALPIPIIVLHHLFSRLAKANAQLEALQGKIANTSKLASVGALSLDLAHQIKNPLAILLGRLETARDRLDPSHPAWRHVELALDAGWRLQEVAQTFNSVGQQRLVPLDIHILLSEACGMAGLFHRTRLEVQWDYQENLPKVAGNPVLLREAFSNIYSNAMEALPAGGVILSKAVQQDGTVMVHISDTGPGIPKEVMEHLFEPFLTTKRGGSGLGLFAAKHIVEMHRGTIQVAAFEGRGTTITVQLPAYREPSTEEAQATQQGDTGTLLQKLSQ